MTFVDTNIFIDVLSEEPSWYAWSLGQLVAARSAGPLLINDVVYAELSVRFRNVATLEDIIARLWIRRERAPPEALFLAAKVFRDYRRAGGPRTSLMPDFFIGAQAAHANAPLLTRDPRRYRTYFPSLYLICP